MSKELLTAIYENKRLLILTTFINHPDKVSPSLAYAYEHRLAPIFHENIAREVHGEDPFAEIYSVKADFMDKVLRYIEENSREETGKKYDFYSLEDVFGHGNRMEILFTIEYARIDRRFDDEVYKTITSNAPVEGNEIASTFEPKEIYFG